MVVTAQLSRANLNLNLDLKMEEPNRRDRVAVSDLRVVCINIHSIKAHKSCTQD